MKIKIKRNLILMFCFLAVIVFTCGVVFMTVAAESSKTTVVLSEESIKVNQQEEVCVMVNVDGEIKKVRYDIQDGASVRLIAPTGIRFRSFLSQKDYETLYWQYGADNVTIGTVIIEKDKYTDNDSFEIGDTNVMNVVAKNISLYQEESSKDEGDGILRFSAVITNIPKEFSAVELYARSYIKIVKDGIDYVGYTPFDIDNNGRSIYDVAKVMLQNKEDVLSNEGRAILENIVATDLTSNVVTVDATLDLSEQLEKTLALDTIDRIYDYSLADSEPLEISETISENEWLTTVDSLVAKEDVRTKILSVYTEENVYRVKVLVATKVIKNADEFMSMRTYEGVALDATNFTCDGYYVLGNNIDLTGKEIGVKFIQSSSLEKHANEGFVGTFDGRGFTVYGGTYYASIFGTLGKDAVIKNLAILNATAKVDHSKASVSVRIIADNTYGTVQDVLVDYTAVGNAETNGVYSVSTFGTMYNSKIENVVIYSNTTDSIAGGGVALTFAEYIFGSGTTLQVYGYPPESVRDELEINNIWSFGGFGNGQTGNFSSGTNSFSHGYLLSSIFVNQIDGHVFGVESSAKKVMEDATFSAIWDLSGNKPSFVSVKEFFATFELYSGLDKNNGYSRIANENFELTCSGMEGEVTVSINGGEAFTATAVNGKITVLSSKFALGENEVVVSSATDQRKINATVYTAIIDSAEEFINMRRYGDVALDATNFSYGGYYVLGNNIDLTGKELGVPFTHNENVGMRANEGFTGTFDGCGYTIYGGTYYGSIFGPLSKDSVLKNVAIINATVQVDHEKVLTDSYMVVCLVSQNAYGTIQDVLIDYSAEGNSAVKNAYNVSPFGMMCNPKIENVVSFCNTSDSTTGGGMAFTFGSYVFGSGRTAEQGYPAESVRPEIEVNNVWSFGGFGNGVKGNTSGQNSYCNGYGSAVFNDYIVGHVFSKETAVNTVMSSAGFGGMWDLSGNRPLFVSSAEFFNN